MSFVIAAPEVMAAAATDLANIGSSISAASAAAAGPTMGILAAGADEVSVAISALFGSHAQGYQTLSAQLAAYHNQFVRALNAGAGSYASAEAANVQQTLLNAINAPTQTLLGRPLIGNGADGGPGRERRERRPTDRQQRGRRGRRKRGRHFSERSSVRIRG